MNKLSSSSNWNQYLACILLQYEILVIIFLVQVTLNERLSSASITKRLVFDPKTLLSICELLITQHYLSIKRSTTTCTFKTLYMIMNIVHFYKLPFKSFMTSMTLIWSTVSFFRSSKEVLMITETKNEYPFRSKVGLSSQSKGILVRKRNCRQHNGSNFDGKAFLWKKQYSH